MQKTASVEMPLQSEPVPNREAGWEKATQRMTAKVFDPSVLAELLDLGDESDREFVIELVEIFLRDAPSRVRAVVDCAERGDLDGVEAAAHALKGSAGNLGAVLVRELAESLQLAGRAHDAATVKSCAPKLRAAYAEAEAELRRYAAAVRAQ